MPCHTRMKRLSLLGLVWTYMLSTVMMVTSLEPGFLDFDNLPETNFTCVGKVIGGYYADLETACQMFHVCTIGQLDEPMDIRFLCLNGTVFDQETRVCERIDEVDCSKSEQFYSLNLELYGNTQTPILEESPETEPPKKKSSTTSTTTARPTQTKTPRPNFIITTHKPPPVTTANYQHRQPQLHRLSSDFPHHRHNQNHHHQGQHNSDVDIRFNPEEYKISLHTSSNRNKPLSFQQFGDNKRVIVTTHSAVYKDGPKSTPKNDHLDQEPTEDSYSYNGYQTERIYQTHTEAPKHQFQFRPSFRPNLDDDFKPSTYRATFHATTNSPLKFSYNHRGPTTYRSHVYAPFRPSQEYYRPEQKNNDHLQGLPSLTPLTFSSPAPFSLSRHHTESKRYTDHHQPPRIVISASASVSDASGKKFNYSLGTIGDSRFFGQPPASYDDYKEGDVSLDPFYRDVPKLRRVKRQTLQSFNQSKSGNSDGEKEAIDVLRFLFNWYNNYEMAQFPIQAETITQINEELTPKYSAENLEPETERPSSVLSLQILKPPFQEVYSPPVLAETTPAPDNSHLYDYVDDNYEPLTYFHKPNVEENVSNVKEPSIYQLPPNFDYPTTTQGNINEEPASYVTPAIIKIPETTTAKNLDANNVQKFPEKSYYATNNYEDIKNTEFTTKAYNKVLGILGITTRKPPSRGKTKFRLDDFQETFESSTQPLKNPADVLVTTPKEYPISNNIFDTSTEHTKEYKENITEINNVELQKLNVTTEYSQRVNYNQQIFNENQTEYPDFTTAVTYPETTEGNVETFIPTITSTETAQVKTTLDSYYLKLGESEGYKTETTDILPETFPTTELIKETTPEVITPESTLTPVSLEKLIHNIEKTTKSQSENQTSYTLTTTARVPTKITTQTAETALVNDLDPTEKPATTPLVETTEFISRRSKSRFRPNPRHRFEGSRSQDIYKKPHTITDEIIGVIKSKMINQSENNKKINEFNINAYTANLAYQGLQSDDYGVTDPSFAKSANPTLESKDLISPSTTPLPHPVRVNVNKQTRTHHYVFNCFDKTINRFYSDPRDCRLFHYCTRGFTRTQYLDMKFVCDLGTFFDEDKLICTKTKPARCT